MNSIKVNTHDLLTPHSGCHGDYILPWQQTELLVHIVPKKLQGKYQLNMVFLLRFYSSYHGGLVGIATKYVADVSTKYELDRT